MSADPRPSRLEKKLDAKDWRSRRYLLLRFAGHHQVSLRVSANWNHFLGWYVPHCARAGIRIPRSLRHFAKGGR